jgi:pimeloyl-ACP methyl ester carboxylesterase
MTKHRAGAAVLLVALAAGRAVAEPAPGQPEAGARPTDHFLTANGIKLHYLDWGGKGDVLLFLTGFGETARYFDPLARHFTGEFRCLGLTRRGAGKSDRPPSGYDTKTLVADVAAFLDALKVDTVTFVGHSLAGDEMTLFASLYPRRVRKLVYLEAAYDRSKVPPSPSSARPSPGSVAGQITKGSAELHPEYARVKVPSLSFYALLPQKPYLPDGITDEERQKRERYHQALRAFQREQIEEFRKAGGHVRIVELEGSSHNAIVSKSKDELVREMTPFLTGKN